MNKNEKISKSLITNFDKLRSDKKCLHCNLQIKSVTRELCKNCWTRQYRKRKKEVLEQELLTLNKQLAAYNISSYEDLKSNIKEVAPLLQKCINVKLHSSWSLALLCNSTQKKSLYTIKKQ